MPTIVVNHMLEPPGRVTGITRFLFALLQGVIDNSANTIVLVTSWQQSQLPPRLAQSRLVVVTTPHYAKLTVNVAMQGLVLSRLMRAHAPAVEFNANPLGFFAGSWPRIITVHDLYLKLMPQDYRARPEQVVLFKVSAWDANCPQHIPQRFEAADVAAALALRDRRIQELEAEIVQLRDRT